MKTVTEKGSGHHVQNHFHSPHLVLMFATRLGDNMGRFYKETHSIVRRKELTQQV